MKALMCRQFGLPDTLTIEDIASPKPKAGEIVVSIKAAGVNFPDCLIIQNRHQIKATLPFTPGYELAGIVKEVGEGVRNMRPGDHGVALVKWGAFAEEIVLPSERFWPVSPQLDFKSAAAFPLAYGTSYHALKNRALIKPGETLLVLGAAGGVGISALQFGKMMGARVIACASSAEKLDLCRRCGADELVNYTTEDLKETIKRLTKGKGVDVVLDPVGGHYAEPAVRSMAWGGRYLIVGFTAGAIPKIALNLILLKSSSLVGVLWDTYTRRQPQAAFQTIGDMADMILAGKLEIIVSAVYPLHQAGEALNDVLARRVQGKAVILT